ncbi:MAG: hypothetical protein ACK5VY_03980 [Alphaproteobacteria bacterium]|jgi:hypothetical protein
MITAIFLMHFFICAPFKMDCEEGRMTHHSCAAAKDWLRAGLKPNHALLIVDCEATNQHNPSAASLWEDPAVPLLPAIEITAGGN